MNSKIKNFYFRLFQVVLALYAGALIGSLVHGVLKSTYAHTAFQLKDFWYAAADTPAKLATTLLSTASLPEKIVWTILYCACGIYAYQSKNLKWFPILVALLATAWVYYEASHFSF